MHYGMHTFCICALQDCLLHKHFHPCTHETTTTAFNSTQTSAEGSKLRQQQ